MLSSALLWLLVLSRGGLTRPASFEEMVPLMKEILDFLDSDPRVERYAW